jgi:microcystin-dependent protein
MGEALQSVYDGTGEANLNSLSVIGNTTMGSDLNVTGTTISKGPLTVKDSLTVSGATTFEDNLSVAGTTASQAFQLGSNTINAFSTSTTLGTSDATLPTQSAVKAYADSVQQAAQNYTDNKTTNSVINHTENSNVDLNDLQTVGVYSVSHENPNLPTDMPTESELNILTVYQNGAGYGVQILRSADRDSTDTHVFTYQRSWDNINHTGPDSWTAWQKTAYVNTKGEVNVGEAGVYGLVPPGTIVMWNGSNSTIPGGWALCNGGNGTPNLTDRFIVGAGSSYSYADQGGASQVTLTENQMPAHDHPAHADEHSHNVGYSYTRSSGDWATDSKISSASGANMATSSETVAITIGSAGSGHAHENRPPYYALAFIMKL